MKYEFKGSTVNGKWKVSRNDNNSPCVIQISSGWSFGTSYIVEDLGQEYFAEYDAHLIAAAPELLKAAVNALETIENWQNKDGEPICAELTQAIHKALNLPL